VKKLLPSGGLTTFSVDHLSSSLDISTQLIDSNGDVHGLSDVSGMDSMHGGINTLMYQQVRVLHFSGIFLFVFDFKIDMKTPFQTFDFCLKISDDASYGSSYAT